MTSQRFILRPATFFDLNQIALVAIAAYKDGPVFKYLNPNATQYPQDVHISFLQTVTKAYLDARHLTLVACSSDSPDVVLAYGMYDRRGDDAGVAKFVHERSWMERMGRWLLSCILPVSFKLYNFIWPDRATSKANNEVFSHSIKMDKERYWSPVVFPRRRNHWHVGSIIVLPEYQGRGIGRLLMEYILDRAGKEGLPAGLTASPAGERLYRKLGFAMLGDFWTRVAGEEDGDGGGHMIWWPEGVEKDGDY